MKESPLMIKSKAFALDVMKVCIKHLQICMAVVQFICYLSLFLFSDSENCDFL